MDRQAEARWQSAWAAAGIARAKRVAGREKFYAVWTYPGPSGFLHVGHLRGLTIADVVHRFHRMRGHQVFFPLGTHASGLPAVTFAQRVKDRDPETLAQLEANGVEPAHHPELEDPEAAARFLGRSYQVIFRSLGILLDDSAYVTTVDEDYRAFIRWQFHRLNAKGVLRQAPHFSPVCPICGPVSVDPSETDLSTGGDAEWVIYHTVPFRLKDGRVLLAATLRPETVYGVTNLWIAPGVPLIDWEFGSRTYLATRAGVERLVEQHGGKAGREVPTSELMGQSARATLTEVEVPILESELVDPAVGTGVVMSVPAHAPADWLAVRALDGPTRSRLHAPPVIVEFPATESLTSSERALLAGDGVPAERAVRATGATQLSDREALENATERLYRLEFVRGRMRADLLEGLPVAQARTRVVDLLSQEGPRLDVQQFSIPVRCRNGHDVVIRRVPDQWFIHYGDPDWKSKTQTVARSVIVDPEEYAKELPGVIDWFDDRPCTRRGRWLGTDFPLDPSWVIEPIADSTFYPAYYIVRRFVSDGRVLPAQLTDSFFDRVFLGQGPGEPQVDGKLQQEVRDEFLYWYPLEANIGGKEHKRVHFPVFLFTHALLLPAELQPKRIFAHWWVTDRGGAKLSKKQLTTKGGSVPPIREAIDRWGADALRLFYISAASPAQDIEWDGALVDQAGQRLAEVERTVRELRLSGGGGPPELESWLEDRWHDVIGRAVAAFEAFRVREAGELVYAETPQLVRRYLARGGQSGPFLHRLTDDWVRLLHPITPHLSEELADGRFPSLVATSPFPSPDDYRAHPDARAAEAFLERVEEDLRNVLRPTTARGEAPTEVAFFVAAEWKRTLEEWARELVVARGNASPIKEIMERARTHPELSAALPEIPKYLQRVAPLLRAEPAPDPTRLDEVRLLRSAEAYLVRKYRFDRVSVYRESEAEEADPLGRRERARPGRPAFFLLPSHSARVAPDSGARTD